MPTYSKSEVAVASAPPSSARRIRLPAIPLPGFLAKDARHFQILYLSIFLVYGLTSLGWDAEIDRYLTLIVTCLVVQYIGIRLTKGHISSLKSGMITALGLCLLFKTNGLATAALAGTVAIASKYLIRFRGKHLFNPANFGIIIPLLFTADGWVSPGQWGSNTLLLFLIGALGSIVVFRVGRLDLPLVFLSVFGGLEFFRSVVYLGWPIDHFTHQMTSGTLLLFAFFMITDPKTTPNARNARIIWAALLGLAAFLVSTQGHLHTAPIWVLFFITPITVLLDHYFKHKKFEWS